MSISVNSCAVTLMASRGMLVVYAAAGTPPGGFAGPREGRAKGCAKRRRLGGGVVSLSSHRGTAQLRVRRRSP